MIVKKQGVYRKPTQTARFSGKVRSVDKESGKLILEERGNVRKITSPLNLIARVEAGQEIAAFVKKTNEGWLLLGIPEKRGTKHRFRECPFG